MIVHTLVYSFSETTSADDLHAFLAELRDVVVGSGLARSVEYRTHLPLPVDEHAPVFVASAIAQITCADAEALRQLGELPALHEFIGRWQTRGAYRTVWVNHEPIVG